MKKHNIEANLLSNVIYIGIISDTFCFTIISFVFVDVLLNFRFTNNSGDEIEE